MGRIKSITGQRFGMLVVIEQAERQERKQTAWHCICDCGKKCIKRGSALRAGWVQSCGCMSGLSRNPNYLKSMTKWLVRIYVGGAKTRDLKFNLSEKQFMELVQKPCYYCGFEGRDWGKIWYREKLRRIEKRFTDTADYRAESFSFIGNGVDRVCNSKPYSISNCVPCCAICNMMKKDLTKEQFLAHINKIAAYKVNID